MKKKLNIIFIYLKRYSFYPMDYLERGLGGSESMLLLLSRAIAKLGHKVEVYNCCFKSGVYDEVSWKPIWKLNPNKQIDVVISLRLLETFRKYQFKSKVRAVWMHDESLDGAEELDKSGVVNMWICISRTQKNLIQKNESIQSKNIFLTRNAFDEDFYNNDLRKINKIKNRTIYCSSPDRGLMCLLGMWNEIKEGVPDASLVVTGSYALWGMAHEENERINKDIYQNFKDLRDVKFLKNVSKAQLTKLQAECEVMLYPTNFNEMFCISTLECLAANTPVITSHKGALTERIRDNFNGFLIKEPYESPQYKQKFIEKAISFLNNPELKKSFSLNSARSVDHMNFEELANEWVAEFQRRLQ